MKKRILVAVVFAVVVGFCAWQRVQARGAYGPLGLNSLEIRMQRPQVLFESIKNLSLEQLEEKRKQVIQVFNTEKEKCSKIMSSPLGPALIEKPLSCMNKEKAESLLQRIDAKIAEEWNRIKGIK